MFVEEKKAGEQQVEIDLASHGLLMAVDYIERNGWCQGRLTEGGGWGGRACAIGAIYLTNGSIASIAYRQFARYLNVADVAGWNDAPGRTQEEVIRALREAAYVR